MNFSQAERIAVFIDGPNLYSTAKALGFDIDFRKLLTFFRARGRLIRALYYTTLLHDQDYSSIQPLVDWLDYNGFTTVTKAVKEYTDVSGHRIFKGNMDVELTVDAMRMADVIDHIVLFTGDGAFKALVAALQIKGKRVSVFSTLTTHPALISDELRRLADQFIDIAHHEEAFARVPTRQ